MCNILVAPIGPEWQWDVRGIHDFPWSSDDGRCEEACIEALESVSAVELCMSKKPCTFSASQ